MNRLLIVDDEHHIVNWLVALFEEQKDMDLTVMKAYTGIEALNILKITKINIILLDINMPGINGLDLADKILSDWPGCRIIFLTGYNNFDYIYYANKQNNITYLLKTEPDEEILRAVSKAIHLIDTEISNLALHSQILSKEKLLNYLFQKEFLQDIILGKHLQEIQEHMNKFEYRFQLDIMKPVYLLYGICNQNYSTQYSVDHNNYLLKLMQITDQVLYNKFNYALLDINRTSILWFLQPSDSFLENNNQTPVIYLKECFDELIFSIQNNISNDIMLLLYYKEISMNMAGNIYNHLNQYAAYTFPSQLSHSFGMIFGEAEEHLILEQNRKAMHSQQWNSQIKNLSYHLSHGEQEKFISVLKNISSGSKELKNLNYLPLLSIYLEISSCIITFINHSILREKISEKLDKYPLLNMNRFSNWEEAFLYLEEIVNVIFNLSNNTQSDKNQKIISVIKNYVADHLSEDLTLTTISDYVNYNSSYVSRLFKQTTGLSLSDYISNCRLNKAKELLDNTNDTIQVIAQKVGFDSSQYFSMVFRKLTGISPRDYRNPI